MNADDAGTPDSLPAALVTWGTWQWGRVALGFAAFVASVLAVRTSAE